MAREDQGGRLVASDEGDRTGLDLGRAEGEAVTRTLRHMIDEVAETGGETRSGDYLIGFAVEKAEGMYVPEDGELRWQEPGDANMHVEIAVRDPADGRLIPGLRVLVTVRTEDGREIGTHEHPLLWHPYLYHYGRNWVLPGSGRYDLHVRFDPPAFPRHDRENGRRFLTPGDATFRGVEMTTGQD